MYVYISVYPRNKKGHGNFIKKGTSSARSPPPPPPPPPHTHTHQRESYILCLYIVFAPLPIQHSFLCSFKWMSLLKTVPQPKKNLRSLFTYMVFVPLKIYHVICSHIAKKSPFPPKLLGGNMSKGNKCYCNSIKGGKLIKNENN